ncbi:hypothetical protein IHE30_00655 [Mycetohabitans sp. B46]
MLELQRVRSHDRQFLVANVKQAATQHAWLGLKICASQAAFDHNLPQARDAKKRRAGWIFE